MQTDQYGVNGTNVNELGQILPPMQVIGRNEPWGSFAATASRGLDKALVCELIARFHHQHGTFPTRYFSAKPLSGLKASSFHVRGVGSCVLDIGHDEGPERVE